MKPYQISTWVACTFERSRASLAEYDVEVTICSHSLKVCQSSPILGREVADRIRDINVGIAGRASRWHCRDRRWPSGRSRRMGGAAAISVAMLGSASAAAALAGRSTQQLCNPCVYVHICGQSVPQADRLVLSPRSRVASWPKPAGDSITDPRASR